MKATLIVLLAGVAFWCGALFAASQQQPNVEVRRITVQPAALQIPCGQRGIEEYLRTCRARSKSF